MVNLILPDVYLRIHPEAPGVLLVRAVHVAAVMEVGDLVHLLPVPEAAAQLGPGHGPDKVHTSLSVSREEGVILRDLDWETLRMFDQSVDGT